MLITITCLAVFVAGACVGGAVIAILATCILPVVRP